MTLYDLVNTVLKRLDDYPVLSGEQVWTRAEVELYVQDGYAAFCRRTKCLFDMFYPENIPAAGNYVAKWELSYFDSGMIAVGLLNYSGGYWEKDYSQPGAIGPANSTQPWEAEYLTTTFAVGASAVPEDNVAVDRATHDFHTLSAEFTRYFEANDRQFQTTEGDPWRFSMDRDGISRIRVVPAGTANATQATVSGTYGLLRSATTEFGTWGPSGTWGILREVPQFFPMGGQYGMPRRLYSDTANTRVEYFRLGKDLDEYGIELPARFTKYVEFYAQARCLERDGPGQDMALSQHFMGRFEDGVSRMVRRLGDVKRQRRGAIGSAGKLPTKPSLARLPWRFGRQIRRSW